jgi:hypothetical protein
MVRSGNYTHCGLVKGIKVLTGLQNITNPYPSEEQKAVFSNVSNNNVSSNILRLTICFQATGISMTQVSNWFINHRRRCPELRDKRDRIRVGGLDGSD